MGWFERLKEMDLVKLRIVTFSALVISFLLALFLLKIGAERLGPTSGGYFPLLPNCVVVKGEDLGSINKQLGKEVNFKDMVKTVEKDPEGGCVLKLTYVSVPLSAPDVALLKKEGKDILMCSGKRIEAQGVLDIHPVYGLQLSVKDPSKMKLGP